MEEQGDYTYMKKGIKIFIVLLIYTVIWAGNRTQAVAAEINQEDCAVTNNPEDFQIVDGVLVKYNGNDEVVRVPDGVVEIGKGAFSVKEELRKIYLADSVKIIGGGAFYKCPNLEYVDLGKLEKIDSYSFGEDVNNIKTVVIPKTLTTVTNTELYMWDPYNGHWVLQVYRGPFGYSGLDNVIFEEGVTVIPKGMFKCSEINHIELPDTLTQIKENAFWGCHNLQSISLPDSITEIESGAFYECNNLVVDKIPASLVTLGDGAFYGCGEITNTRIPKTLKGRNANNGGIFNGTNLKNVSFEEGIKVIPSHIFADAYVPEVVLPDSVEEIGDGAFHSSSLQKIVFPQSLKRIGNDVFVNCEMQEIDLPDSLTHIGIQAFGWIYKLKTIKFGTGIKEIRNSWFSDCYPDDVYLPETITHIEDGSINRWTYPKSENYNVNIHGKIGSYAETYAKENNFNFIDVVTHAESITVSPENNIEMGIDDKVKLDVTVTPIDCDETLKFKSSNTNVITVDQDGVITAVGEGDATVKIVVGSVIKAVKVKVTVPKEVSPNKNEGIEYVESLARKYKPYFETKEEKDGFIEWIVSDADRIIDEFGDELKEYDITWSEALAIFKRVIYEED